MDAIGLDVVITYDSLALGALCSDYDRGATSGDATMNLRRQINSNTSKATLSLNLRARHRPRSPQNGSPRRVSGRREVKQVEGCVGRRGRAVLTPPDRQIDAHSAGCSIGH